MLAGAGGVDHGSLVKLAEEHFKGLGIEYEGQTPEVAPCRFTGKSFGDSGISNVCVVQYRTSRKLTENRIVIIPPWVGS